MGRAALGFGLLGLVALAGLAGCVSSSPGQDYALACQFEVNPTGAYEYPAGVAVPTVVPGAGGSQAGADALNACIRAKAGAAGRPTAAPKVQKSVPPAPRGATAATVQATAPGMPRPRAGEGCALKMVGGTGYICAQPHRRMRY